MTIKEQTTDNGCEDLAIPFLTKEKRINDRNPRDDSTQQEHNDAGNTKIRYHEVKHNTITKKEYATRFRYPDETTMNPK